MPTLKLDNHTMAERCDKTASTIKEAAHFLRSSGNIYSINQAKALEQSYNDIVEVAGCLRLKVEEEA